MDNLAEEIEQPLFSLAAFNDRFEQHLKKATTHKAAYELTEADFSFLYLRKRYSNFDSFKQARLRWLRARLKKGPNANRGCI